MKIMVLASEPPEEFARRETGDAAAFEAYMKPWRGYVDMLGARGAMIDGSALEAPGAATVVSVREGKRRVEDGPFPDAKEQLGGFFILEAKDMDDAVALAAACPSTTVGSTTVWPVPHFERENAS